LPVFGLLHFLASFGDAISMMAAPGAAGVRPEICRDFLKVRPASHRTHWRPKTDRLIVPRVCLLVFWNTLTVLGSERRFLFFQRARAGQIVFKIDK
jgi:hypothetical protein